MVNIIYGSFATAVVALLVTEAAALILLLGAQVIAELERKTDELTDESKPMRKGVTAMKRIRMSVGCFVLILLVAFLGASASTANCESTGEYIDDSVITTKVKSLLASDDFIKSFQISVETYKGIVQMTGVVDSQRAIDKAGEIARSVAGVKSVRNDLLVK
jgi:hypothetical protein